MATVPPATGSRVTLRNIPWETYEALIRARGDDPAPRFTYDTGTLEITSPSRKHERIKTLLGRLIEAYTEEMEIPISAGGSTTLQSRLEEKGLEPDESYFVESEPLVRGKDDLDLSIDPPPDLVVEIDLSRSSVEKLAAYASLGVPEVWSYEGDVLRMYRLEASGPHTIVAESGVFPGLRASDLARFVSKRTEVGETTLVRSFRAWVRERLGSP